MASSNWRERESEKEREVRSEKRKVAKKEREGEEQVAAETRIWSAMGDEEDAVKGAGLRGRVVEENEPEERGEGGLQLITNNRLFMPQRAPQTVATFVYFVSDHEEEIASNFACCYSIQNLLLLLLPLQLQLFLLLLLLLWGMRISHYTNCANSTYTHTRRHSRAVSKSHLSSLYNTGPDQRLR